MPESLRRAQPGHPPSCLALAPVRRSAPAPLMQPVPSRAAGEPSARRGHGSGRHRAQARRRAPAGYSHGHHGLQRQTLQKWASRSSRTSRTRCPASPSTTRATGEKRYILRGVQSAGQEQVAVYYDEVPAPGIQSSSGDSGSQTTDLDARRPGAHRGAEGSARHDFRRELADRRGALHREQAVSTEVEGNSSRRAESLQHGDPGAQCLGHVQSAARSRTSSACARRRTTTSAGGYVDNVRLGTNEINSVETHGGRAILRYQPAESHHYRRHALAAEARRGRREWLSRVRHVSRRRRPGQSGANDRVPAFAFFDTGAVQQRRLRAVPAAGRPADLSAV